MATNKDPIFLNTLSTNGDQIAVADGTTAVTLFTAGADGGAVLNLTATTTDTSDVILELKVNDGTDTVKVGEVTVPAGSGTDGATPPANVLDSSYLPGVLQADGSLMLGNGAALTVNAKSALSTGVLDLFLTGGSYSA